MMPGNIDLRSDAVETPFSNEEEASLIYSEEGRIKATLKMILCQNIQLIWHLDEWKKHRAHKGLKPEKDVALLLSPGLTKDNLEVENLKSLARFYSKFPHGETPQFDEFHEASKSYFSLMLHIGSFASTEHLYNARESFKVFRDLVTYTGEPQMDMEVFGGRLFDSIHKFIDERRVNAMEVGIFLSTPPKPKDEETIAAAVPLDTKRDEIRKKAVSLIAGYQRKYNCSTSTALQAVQKVLWRKFESVGLKSAVNNFKYLFYSSRFRGSPPADDDDLRVAGLDT